MYYVYFTLRRVRSEYFTPLAAVHLGFIRE